MPKKLKKAAAGKKRGGSSSQQVDHTLMFASDFTDFKADTFRHSNSDEDDDDSSDIEAELLAHYYFSSTSSSNQLPDRLDTFLRESFDITTPYKSQIGCHDNTKKQSTNTTMAAAASKRSSISDDNSDKGHVARRPKRHRSSAEEGEIIVLSSSSEEGGASEGGSEDMDLDSTDYSGDQQWSIDQKDMMGRNTYEKRYGAIKQRGFGRLSKCFNCKQKGHATSMCPHPKRNQVCYLCGTVGHVSMRCPDSRCQYCFQRNHRGRQCNPSYSFGTCGRCYVKGHVDSNCPDGWRQFHNTMTKDRELVKFTAHKMKSHCVPYCANCAQRGHFVHECPRYRPRGVPYPFLPYIARYNDNQFPRPRPHHNESQSSQQSSSKQHRRASLPDYSSRSADKRKHEEDDSYHEPSRKKSKHRRHEERFPHRTHTDPLPNPAHHSTPHPYPPPRCHDDGLLSTPPLRSLSFEHSRTPHMPPPPQPFFPPPQPFSPPPQPFSPPPQPFSPSYQDMPPLPPAHFHHHVNQEEHFPRTPFTQQHYSQPSSAHIPHPPPQHRPPTRRRHSEGWSPHGGRGGPTTSRVNININGYWDNSRGFVKERSRR